MGGFLNMVESVKTWLNKLAAGSISEDRDNAIMQNILKRVGFPNAVVTCGVVYPLGSGQPKDIHSMAKELIEICEGVKQ